MKFYRLETTPLTWFIGFQLITDRCYPCWFSECNAEDHIRYYKEKFNVELKKIKQSNPAKVNCSYNLFVTFDNEADEAAFILFVS